MSIISYSEDKGFVIELNQKEGQEKKQWQGKLDICRSPTCSCQTMTFELHDIENRETTLPMHRISFDVFDKKPVKLQEENAASKDDFQLTKSFVKNLTENDWDQLRKIFLGFKRNITESTPITDLNVPFPEKDIENDALMIGYSEIFPYPEELWIELYDIKYLIDDQYCLVSTCSCTHVALTFFAIKNGQALDKNKPLAIMFDYKSKSYKIENRGSKKFAAPKELIKEIFRKKLDKIFKDRHKKLRFLYKNFRKNKKPSYKKSINQPMLSTKTNGQKKIGRNEPCPCGSGKKYKKCCLGKK